MTIDGCVHHHWGSQLEVMEYMSRGWREYLGQPSSLPGGLEAIPALPAQRYRHPEGDELSEVSAAGSSTEARFDLLREQLLDGAGVDRAVLAYDAAMYAPLAPSPYMARELVRAANDWTIDHWLARDPRLHGLILVPTQSPEDSVAEIRRLGGSAHMAGVLVAASGLGRPFGHPIYHPILKAAAEHALPVVIHASGDAVGEVLTHHTAGGYPTTYADYSILRPQSLATHLVSLIAQGVFAKFPGLRVIVQGAGVAWIPSLFWRFDSLYHAYRREAPWVTRMPTEYLRDHIRICTNPLDVAPTDDRLIRALEAFGAMADLMIFGSGYPHRDMDWPQAIADRIPEDWHARVFSENALDSFRWSPPTAPVEQPAVTVGQMEPT